MFFLSMFSAILASDSPSSFSFVRGIVISSEGLLEFSLHLKIGSLCDCECDFVCVDLIFSAQLSDRQNCHKRRCEGKWVKCSYFIYRFDVFHLYESIPAVLEKMQLSVGAIDDLCQAFSLLPQPYELFITPTIQNTMGSMRQCKWGKNGNLDIPGHNNFIIQYCHLSNIQLQSDSQVCTVRD